MCRIFTRSYLDRIVVGLTEGATIVLRSIAGIRDTAAMATFRSAQMMDFSTRDDLAAVDYTNMQAFFMRKGGKLELLAGNGKEGFVPEAGSSLEAPLDVMSDICWNGDSSILISTWGDHPAIHRVTVGGQIKVIAGTGEKLRAGDIRTYPIPATNVRLSGPHDVIPLADGRILFFDRGLPLVLKTNGELDTYGDWPREFTEVNQGYRHVVRLGDRFIMFDGDSGGIVSIENGEKTMVLTSLEIRSALGGDDIRSIAVDQGFRLYIGSVNRVIQRDLGTGKQRPLVGEGGVINNQGSRDGAVISLRDLKVADNGDLIVLELEQVKRLPKYLLDFQ